MREGALVQVVMSRPGRTIGSVDALALIGLFNIFGGHAGREYGASSSPHELPLPTVCAWSRSAPDARENSDIRNSAVLSSNPFLGHPSSYGNS